MASPESAQPSVKGKGFSGIVQSWVAEDPRLARKSLLICRFRRSLAVAALQSLKSIDLNHGDFQDRGLQRFFDFGEAVFSQFSSLDVRQVLKYTENTRLGCFLNSTRDWRLWWS
jgi:hypothetical protein